MLRLRTLNGRLVLPLAPLIGALIATLYLMRPSRTLAAKRPRLVARTLWEWDRPNSLDFGLFQWGVLRPDGRISNSDKLIRRFLRETFPFVRVFHTSNAGWDRKRGGIAYNEVEVRLAGRSQHLPPLQALELGGRTLNHPQFTENLLISNAMMFEGHAHAHAIATATGNYTTLIGPSTTILHTRGEGGRRTFRVAFNAAGRNWLYDHAAEPITNLAGKTPPEVVRLSIALPSLLDVIQPNGHRLERPAEPVVRRLFTGPLHVENQSDQLIISFPNEPLHLPFRSRAVQLHPIDQ